MATIAVTGSTGALGRQVSALLAEAGVEQRLVVRDRSRAPVLPGASVAVADYSDVAAAATALAGTEILFMVSGAEAPDRVAHHRAFVDAARAAGVRHVVYTSFYGAAPDATFTLARDHAATEHHLRGSGMAFTFLRDNLYLDFFAMLAGADGVIRGPAGDGRVAAVARDDIAEVAATILLAPDDHAGAGYDLTGPESLDLGEVAAILTERTGRPVRYHAESVAEAYESRGGYGAPQWQLDAWVSTYTAIAAGELATPSPDLQALLGRPGRTLAQVLAAAG